MSPSGSRSVPAGELCWQALIPSKLLRPKVSWGFMVFYGDSRDSLRFIPWYDIRYFRFFIQILSSCLLQAQALRVEHEALREAEQSSAELDAFEAVMRSVHDGWAVLLSWWSCHCPRCSEWVKLVKNQQNWRHFLMWLRRACNVQEQRQRHVLLAQQKTQQQEIQAIKRHAVSYKQTNVRALAGS